MTEKAHTGVPICDPMYLGGKGGGGGGGCFESANGASFCLLYCDCVSTAKCESKYRIKIMYKYLLYGAILYEMKRKEKEKKQTLQNVCLRQC